VALINADDAGAASRHVVQDGLGDFEAHAERCSWVAAVRRRSCNRQ
jgi:hypothetical protein